MQTEMIRTITNMLRETREGLTVNRMFHRLAGKHKADIKHALKLMITKGSVEKHTLTGEVAKYLQVPDGTEFYILMDNYG